MLVAQLCPTLCDSKNYSPPSSSVHGILQARILEWIAILFSNTVVMRHNNVNYLTPYMHKNGSCYSYLNYRDSSFFPNILCYSFWFFLFGYLLNQTLKKNTVQHHTFNYLSLLCIIYNLTYSLKYLK